MSFDSHEGQTHSHSPEHTHKAIHHNVLEGHHAEIKPAEPTDLPPIPKYVEPAQKPSVGRIVHFVLDGGPHKGEHRPAIITKIWPEYNGIQHVQLQVFTDGSNDGEQYKSGIYWATSVTYADESENKPYSWHWPERV